MVKNRREKNYLCGSLRILCVSAVIITLLAAMVAAQEDEKQQLGRRLRQGEVRGTVTFSDGTSITGIIHQTGWRPLKVFDTRKKKYKRIPLEHIAVLKVRVTKAQMVKEWRFVEESKDDKEYSGEEYPRKDYEVHITLRGGQELRGTCVGIFYVESADEKTRFRLKHWDRGKTDQVLDDLVHVREIKLADPKAKAAGGRMFGVVKPEGELEAAIAVQHRYKMFVKGKVQHETGKYVIKDLLPGYYDLVLVTKECIFLCPGMKGEDFAEDSLNAQDKKDIAARVWEIKDFFEEKRVLHAAGNVKRAKAVVKTVRKGKTSLEKQGDLPLVFFHIEYWVLHKVGQRWLVDWRIQLVREKGEQETKKDTRRFVLRPELADKRIKADGTRLRVDFDVGEADSGDEDDVIGR